MVLTSPQGDQRAEHERRAGGTDVQELPIERAVPPGRSVDASIAMLSVITWRCVIAVLL